MMRIGKTVFAGVLGALMLIGISGAATASLRARPGSGEAGLHDEEYNAYMKAHGEADTQAQIKLLDDFTAKYPKSALLVYIYNDYYNAYYKLKDYPKTDRIHRQARGAERRHAGSTVGIETAARARANISCGRDVAGICQLRSNKRRRRIRRSKA